MIVVKIQPDDVFVVEVVIETTALKKVRRKLSRQFKVVVTESRIELVPTGTGFDVNQDGLMTRK